VHEAISISTAPFAMRGSTLLRVFLLSVWLPILLPTNGWAQEVRGEASMPTGLLARVLEYRLSFIERDTPFETCSLLRLMATPADLPGALPEWVRPYLTPVNATSCRPTPVLDCSTAPDVKTRPRLVLLDSLSLGNTEAVVFATVDKGENVHRENYMVDLINGRWGVREVRVLGAMRFYRVC
jgi:hypothetical protein